MRNVLTIAGRELAAYFGSPVAYVVMAMFLLINGFLFSIVIVQSQQADMSFAFSDMAIILVFVAPGITMRLLAEEQRLGTIELLLTAPVRDWEVVIGKFLSSFVLFLAMLALTLLYPLFLIVWGHPDYNTIASGYVGIILVGAVFLSLGLLASTLTQNQLVAFLIAFVVGLVLWLFDGISSSFSGTASSVLSYLAVQPHQDSFSTGNIQSKDIIYLVSLTVCALFVAIRVLETRRYR